MTRYEVILEGLDGLSIEDYHGFAALSATSLKDMLTSPLLYQWRRDNGRVETDVLRVGRAVHTAVLEPHRFEAEYVVFPGKVRRGKEWDAFALEAKAQSQTVLTLVQRETSMEIAAAVRANPLAMALLDGAGRPEVALIWNHARTGRRCKARIDWLGDGASVELKTARDVDPRGFANAFVRYGYHVQVAHYRAGLEACGLSGRGTKVIAAQNQPPWDVVVYDVPEDVVIIGEEAAEAAIDRIVACEAAGLWPGVAQGKELELKLPAWAVPNWDDQLTFGGEELSFGDGS